MSKELFIALYSACGLPLNPVWPIDIILSFLTITHPTEGFSPVNPFRTLAIFIALKKRPIDTETTEKFISRISRSLEELGQSEISTNTIGTMVMEGLKELDPVAYVRFASVYRNFREEKDFVQFVDKLDVYKKR